MSQPVIEVKDLSKVYQIGHERKGMKGTATFRDALSGIVKKPLELITGHRLKKEDFWALRDINFEAYKGDVVGIIGKNGSGKSTTLKILSQIVEPTKGEIIIRGKVASLLEVGTGFHPELTGRENIFLNGAILGMKKREIQNKFDEIVAFSEVEKFLDTPVKFYSSGMYVRLAFSVAAHLEPDILIVDEVLAVGDADFQKKSLGKMQNVTRDGGRTVIFVSHNLTSIQSICNRVLVMDQGRLVFEGSTREGILHYLGESAHTTGYVKIEGNENRSKLRFEAIELIDSKDQRRGEYSSGEHINVQIDYRVKVAGENYQLAAELWNEEGICILSTTDFDADPERRKAIVETGSYRCLLKLPTDILREGQYYLTVSASIPGVEVLDEVNYAIAFSIEGNADMKKNGQNRNGAIYQKLSWDIKRRSNK